MKKKAYSFTAMSKLGYLKMKLDILYPDKPFFVGYQCGLVEAGYRGVNLHDDTCAIITSDEYLKLFK